MKLVPTLSSLSAVMQPLWSLIIFFDVGQAQTETFNVMNVAAGGTIKAFKYFFEVFFFDADTVVPDSYN
jgi:hypothetical protein